MLLSWYKNFEFSEVKEKATAAAAAVTSVAANRIAATPTAVIVTTTTTTCKHRNQPNVNAVYVNKKRFESMKMCWMPVCVLYFFPNFILVRVFFSVRSFLFVSAVHSRFIYYIRLGFHLYWWGLRCSFHSLSLSLYLFHLAHPFAMQYNVSRNWFDCGFVRCKFFVVLFDFRSLIVRSWMCCVFERIFHLHYTFILFFSPSISLSVQHLSSLFSSFFFAFWVLFPLWISARPTFYVYIHNVDDVVSRFWWNEHI